MPRDGTFTPSDDILDTLISARAKFTGPESWFRNGYEPWGDGANCLGTALGWDQPAAAYLLGVAGVDEYGSSFLASWNNAPNWRYPNEHRTYEDVIDLLDRAIEKRRALVGELVA